ncbi:MAG TPA: helix-turn-helix transcriptional regulator [Patescibacteria group bacterium]
MKKNFIPLEESELFKDFTLADEIDVAIEVLKYDILLAVRNFRKKFNLTQEQLAQKASLPRTTITKIESGNYNPTIKTLMTIAEALDKKLKISFE